MGFGLHIGWAIEGAIGSPCKVLPSLTAHGRILAALPDATVSSGTMWQPAAYCLFARGAVPHALSSLCSQVDASYLSPNVNMAARLEAASRQYGVTILVSEAFYALLSPRVKACESLAPLYAVVRMPLRNVLDCGLLCCNKACSVATWSGHPECVVGSDQHCCACRKFLEAQF